MIFGVVSVQVVVDSPPEGIGKIDTYGIEKLFGDYSRDYIPDFEAALVFGVYANFLHGQEKGRL